MMPLFIGGCVRALCERRRKGFTSESDPGVLAASGLVAGEGLAGVVVAGLVASGAFPKQGELWIGGHAGEWAVVVAIVALCGFLYQIGSRRD
jgi:hypothetical protein